MNTINELKQKEIFGIGGGCIKSSCSDKTYLVIGSLAAMLTIIVTYNTWYREKHRKYKRLRVRK